MNELEWLVEERPDVRPPTARVTGRAREALVAHTAPKRPARSRRPILVGLAIDAAAVVVAALPHGVEPPKAAVALLVRLSHRIAAERVEEGTEDFHAVLQLTATDYPDHYEEKWIVDAVCGVVRKMVGGTAGRRPDVTVTHEIQRVDAAKVLQS